MNCFRLPLTTVLMAALYVFTGLAAWPQSATAGDWPRFRGPHGSGVARNGELPVKWTLDDFAWKTPLPGGGNSSPVVRGTRLFITSAADDGKSRSLHCLSTKTGKILWTRAISSLGSDSIHAQSSYASTTPALSARTVVVTFADDKHYLVAAYDLDGTPRWTRDIGPFEANHGHGASPIIWNGLVIVPDDQDGASSYVALDELTGEQRWRVARESAVASYSTPLILDSPNEAAQLITTSDGMGITSLNPQTGETLWSTGSLPTRTVSSPVLGDRLVFQACGVGGTGRLLVGVDPALHDPTQPRAVYEVSKRIPYVPTPIFFEDHLYLWGDGGIVVCLKPTDPEPVWMERTSGDFSSSPICAGGNLYNVSKSGEVVVLRAAPKFEFLGRSPLGESSKATPAVANGCLFFRTWSHVLCLPSDATKSGAVSKSDSVP